MYTVEVNAVNEDQMHAVVQSKEPAKALLYGAEVSGVNDPPKAQMYVVVLH